jgi:hypothetical protein
MVAIARHAQRVQSDIGEVVGAIDGRVAGVPTTSIDIVLV